MTYILWKLHHQLSWEAAIQLLIFIQHVLFSLIFPEMIYCKIKTIWVIVLHHITIKATDIRLFYHLLVWLYFSLRFHIYLSNISYNFYWSCWQTFWWLGRLKAMELAVAMLKVEAPPSGSAGEAAPILLPSSKEMWGVSECPWFYQQEHSMLYPKELS